jgi:prepilin-type N-terminal cleavage/methylation domain-containing protein
MFINKNTNQQSGFTFVELLIAITIIAILAVIVILSLFNARAKSKDTSVKDGLNQTRIQADLYYSTGSTYLGLCDGDSDNLIPKGINGMVYNAGKINGYVNSVTVNGNGTSPVRCNASANGWAAEVPLKNETGYYCVDYNRKGITTTNSIGNGANYAFCR